MGRPGPPVSGHVQASSPAGRPASPRLSQGRTESFRRRRPRRQGVDGLARRTARTTPTPVLPLKGPTLRNASDMCCFATRRLANRPIHSRGASTRPMPRSCGVPTPFIRSLRCRASTRSGPAIPTAVATACANWVWHWWRTRRSRGFLAGTVDVTSLPPGDARKRLPRFRTTANQVIADVVRALAENRGVAPAQLALTWVHARGGRAPRDFRSTIREPAHEIRRGRGCGGGQCRS